ncbi:arginine--tRNA ligase [Helicobacter cappadocius]|uniref:Arginine--tRNA ligase n=1 Tax=Helicobacter cappadocius TaxID=3063998 RepID=A0AA90PKJ5_9HELI|nr:MULTISPECIES: arginine--tRNA ligase [unclassified Helicobacter]MDO7253365.1 arginine--tRNA ligase [Helicobacter sp. faydin-H75]MDP2539205.1 arginine--tRNA ligase [Helicobacter sp. faydin-H76]
MYHYVKKLLEDRLKDSIVLERPKNKDHGHYATPIAFSLAKQQKKSPVIIAQEIAKNLSDVWEFEKVDALNGYLNITLSADFFEHLCTEALKKGDSFGSQKPNKEKILLEYVSANPTGPLHIGHARGAVFGDSLSKIGRFLGYEIDTEYYINDAGSQIQMLGFSIYLAGKEYLLGESVHYPDEYYKGEYILDVAILAKEEYGIDVFKNETSILLLSEFGKAVMLEEIKENLSDVGIVFDKFVSEKSLYDRWDATMAKLEKNDGIYEKDHKIWIRSEALGDEKDRVIVRENTEPTYLAGDIIYHDDKFMRGYDRYINIWGADHHGYIPRVKAAIHYLGYDENKLEVLLSQMVSLLKGGQPYKMSKRAGNFILMKDVVNDIGSDALRFIFLSKKSDTHLEFDVDELKKQDASNPIFYINYANARIHTLFEKSSLQEAEILQASLDCIPKEAQNLLFNALSFPRAIEMAFDDRGLQKVCEYLKVLSADFHSFYNSQKIIQNPIEASLLKVCKVVSLSITIGFRLLGIEAKTKM